MAGAQFWLSTGQTAILVAARSYVRVTTDGVGADAASPYNANPWDLVIADTSRGSVVINAPSLNGRGTAFTVKHDENTSLAAATVTVNEAAGQALSANDQTPGAFVASYQFPPANTPPVELEAYRGKEVTWFNGGSAGGVLQG